MPRQPTREEIAEAREKLRDDDRKHRAKMRQKQRRLERAERDARTREAVAFWEKRSPQEQAALLDEPAAKKILALGRLTLECVQQPRSANPRLDDDLRKTEQTFVNPSDRARFRNLFGLK